MNKIKVLMPENSNSFNSINDLEVKEFDIDPNLMAAYVYLKNNEQLNNIDRQLANAINSLNTDHLTQVITNNYTVSESFSYPASTRTRDIPVSTLFLSIEAQRLAYFRTSRYSYSTINEYLTRVRNTISNVTQNINSHKEILNCGYVCIQNTPSTSLAQTETAVANSSFVTQSSNIYDDDTRPYLNYVKMNLVGSFDSKPIFSGFVEDVYQEFKNDSIALSDYNYFFQPFCTKWSVAKKYSYVSRDFGKYSPYLGLVADVSSLNLELMDKIQKSSSKHFKVIEVPGWNRKQENQASLSIKLLPKSHIRMRKACLIPTLFKMQYRDEDYNLKDCWMFSLTLNTSIKAISINNIICINSIIEKLFIADGLKFINPDKYSNQRYQNMSNFSCYSKDLFDKISLDDLILFNTYMNKQPELILPNNSRYSPLTKTLNINPQIKANYENFSHKIEDTKQSLKTKISNFIKEYNDIKVAVASQVEALKRIEENKNNFYKNPSRETFRTISNNLDFFSKMSKQIKIFEAQYQQEVKRTLDAEDFTYDTFFDNLNKENVYVNEIVYTINGTSYTLDNQENLENFINQKSLSESYSISKLTITITKPQKIKVDNDPNKVVVGGPYKVVYDAASNQLHIGILELPAVFGYNSEYGTYYIHPHTYGTSSLFQNLSFYSAKGCLGEASPLLHNAAKVGNIKILLYSILIWVRSANSADVWGRNYIYFPSLNQVNLEGAENFNEIKEQTSTTEIEVESFLESVAAPQEPEENEDDEEDTLDDPEAIVVVPNPAPSYNRYTTFQNLTRIE